MKKWQCVVCGLIYDEAEGWPEDGIEPGTKWEDVGTKAGERFYCPDVSAKFIGDRLNLFSDQAAAAFRLNNVFAPLRVKEGLRKSLYKGFWKDLMRVKIWRIRLVTLSLLFFKTALPLKLMFTLYKFFK